MTTQNNKFNIIGSAFGHGAKIHTTNLAPNYLQNTYNINLKLGSNFKWFCTIDNVNKGIRETDLIAENKGKYYNAVLKHNIELAETIERLVKIENEMPVVIGGDHSCGIGTWSGVVTGLDAQKNFGLIWVDAHMDAHTFKTSPSKAYHGMPVATLLGKGNSDLCNIGSKGQKIKPENLVLIGIRSFEEGERALLESCNVKIFYASEVKERGIKVIFEEALAIATHHTQGFGISIDLDAFDPIYAPGVGSPEPNGLDVSNTIDQLSILFSSKQLKCLEITEFNPELDDQDKTADILHQILQALKASQHSQE